MSEIQQNVQSTVSLSSHDDAAKTNALISYALMILGLFTGLFWIVGAVWAMVKKDDAGGSIFEDHYSNIIKTFWWGLIFSVVGFALAFFVVGYFVLIAVWIWSIVRIIKGLARITSNKSYK